jgi:hypothetical protein
MLYAYLYTICFVFCYTSWCFYAFSRTNLLTRCYSASSLFSVILCFRKATQEIFSELDEIKAKIPVFSEAWRSPKMIRRGSRRWPRHPWHGPPPGRARGRYGPLVHFLTCPSTYIFPSMGKPKEPWLISTKHTASRRRHRREIRRVQKLFSVRCRRGKSPPEAFFITMPASGVMCE